jgi:lipoprotein-anchoring transpeptidase ErfK/SrfK
MAVVMVALVAAGCGSAHKPLPESSYRYKASGLVPVSSSPSAALASFASDAVASVFGHVPGTSLVAWSLAKPVAAYRSPRSGTLERRFPIRDEFGNPQVFLVKRAIPGWFEVYMPVRPNDSTAWIRSGSVELTTDPYEVQVNVAAHELTVLREGRAVVHTRVGVGEPTTPTPQGYFYIIEKLKMVPATGPYGTYAFGLSAYSNSLTTFGTGDAQIALHGTDEPASIGQNWSHGCVHMLDSVADWMARALPLGTPVQIS